jgi:hypothetical protein
MLVFSRIFYGMLLGLILIFISEVCLANQSDNHMPKHAPQINTLN